MGAFDWLIVSGTGLAVALLAWRVSRRTQSDQDWFLAGRNLPYWVAGISMFATSIDAGELVSVTGHTFQHGISILSHYWIGLPIAYVLAAFVVLPRMYRLGMFTNAEYLEARFGATARILSVLVQVQYRTNILAGMSIALHLVLTDVAKLSNGEAWFAVGLFAAVTTIYTATGGLKTIASMDPLLSGIMIISTTAFWAFLVREAGGWNALTQTLDSAGLGSMLSISRSSPPAVPVGTVVLQWIIIAVGFVVVNHTQTMKMLGARSLWDLRMSVLVVVGLTSPVIFLNATFGVIAQAILPETIRPLVEARPDRVFPQIVNLFSFPGFKGLMIIGVIAAAVTTFEGIGSALGALVTRDIYARVLRPGKSPTHYLRVGRISTCLIVLLSFLYIPFILSFGTMMGFFLRITSILVTPLMTVYLMGTATRAHRASAVVGLAVGATYGIAAMLLDGHGIMPEFMTQPSWTYLWSMLLTGSAMAIFSYRRGWEEKENLIQMRNDSGWQTRSGRPSSVETRSMRQPALLSAAIIVVNLFLAIFIFG